MTKLFIPRTLIFILLILITAGTAYSQDTAKKVVTAKPVATKPAVKYNPYAKKNTYKPVAGAAQTPGAATAVTPPVTTDKSLRGQYQYLLTKVYNYQQPLVSALFKNYSDTLTITRRQLKEARATLSAQAQTIDTLKKSVAEKDQTLTQSNARRDEVNLVGIPLTKSTYNLIMWGLVIVFGAVAAIVIARSGSHSREASYRIKLYNELEEEYKAYKTKANEKEKKLARELQTERNKLDELRGNG